MNNIAFGIAGWSYADWNGIVYPERVGDKLGFVSGYVDCIEINSSFYHPPSARTTSGWIRRIEGNEDFFFTAKLPMEITHRGLLDGTIISIVHEGFAPISEAGKLRHLLAQFKYDFANSPENLKYLRDIQSSFADLADIVLELRHNSWQSPSTLARLDSMGVAVANLDYPTGRDSFNLRECRVGRRRYMRLHGRNSEAWFDRNAGRNETYNYFYSNAELQDIADRAESLKEGAENLTVIANNHFEGKALANILQLKAMMTGEKQSVPEGLFERYPELRQTASDGCKTNFLV